MKIKKCVMSFFSKVGRFISKLDVFTNKYELILTTLIVSHCVLARWMSWLEPLLSDVILYTLIVCLVIDRAREKRKGKSKSSDLTKSLIDIISGLLSKSTPKLAKQKKESESCCGGCNGDEGEEQSIKTGGIDITNALQRGISELFRKHLILEARLNELSGNQDCCEEEEEMDMKKTIDPKYYSTTSSSDLPKAKNLTKEEFEQGKPGYFGIDKEGKGVFSEADDQGLFGGDTL